MHELTALCKRTNEKNVECALDLLAVYGWRTDDTVLPQSLDRWSMLYLFVMDYFINSPIARSVGPLDVGSIDWFGAFVLFKTNEEFYANEIGSFYRTFVKVIPAKAGDAETKTEQPSAQAEVATSIRAIQRATRSFSVAKFYRACLKTCSMEQPLDRDLAFEARVQTMITEGGKLLEVGLNKSLRADLFALEVGVGGVALCCLAVGIPWNRFVEVENLLKRESKVQERGVLLVGNIADATPPQKEVLELWAIHTWMTMHCKTNPDFIKNHVITWQRLCEPASVSQLLSPVVHFTRKWPTIIMLGPEAFVVYHPVRSQYWICGGAKDAAVHWFRLLESRYDGMLPTKEKLVFP